MVIFVQSGCIRAKAVVFRKKWLYSGKIVSSGKGGYIRAKWQYSDKSGSIRAKVIVLGGNLLYSRKSGCLRAKWLYSGKKCCILAKWL